MASKRVIAIDLLANDKLGKTFREAAGDVDKLKDTFEKTGVSAGLFDKELNKLERQERALERQNARNETALRMLAAAQKDAADAAEKLERGEIKAEEAAKIQANAEKRLNRVLQAQALASAAAAKEAHELAEEQRQAARAAELGAAKTRLAQLKAVGATDEHNHLVAQLRAKFPDLADSGDRAFTAIASSSKKAGVSVGRLGSAGLPAVAVALSGLPWLASAAGSAITLGVGGALIGVGVIAAAQSEKVKRAFKGLRENVVADLKDMAKPFEDTLVKSIGFARDAFDDLAPTLRESFEDLAPMVTAFSHSFFKSLSELKPAIRDVTKAMGPLLGAIGDELPQLMGRLSSAISRVAKSADPKMLSGLIDGLGLLITAAGHAVAGLTKLSEIFYKFGPLAIAARNVDNFGRGLKNLFGSSKESADGLDNLRRNTLSAGVAAATTKAAIGLMGIKIAGSTVRVKDLKTSMQLASMTAEDLKAALDALSGKTLNLREATSAYEAAIDAATASLKENGRAHGFATEKGRANEAALDAIATSAQNLSVRMKEDGATAQEVTRHMESARQKFIATALKMHYTRDEAIKLADKMFGVRDAAKSIPSARQTKISTPGVGDAIRASKQLRSAVLDVPRERHITYYVHNQGNAIRASKALYRAHGGPVGFAAGGAVQGFPTGGAVRGPGTATSDSIPAMLSNGEFVINAAATSKFRPLLEAINSGRGKSSNNKRSVLRSTGAASGGPQEVVFKVEFGSDGSKVGDFVMELVRKGVRVRGGNVQTVLGK